MKFSVACLQDQGTRRDQQDAMRVVKDRGSWLPSGREVLGIVADGVGGLQYGGLAAQAAVDSFAGEYLSGRDGEDVPETLARSLVKAHRAVLTVSRQADATTASTLVAAVLHDSGLYWISSGDSRAYLIRAGIAFRLTVDHNHGTQLDYQVVEGTLDHRTAMATEGREELTSCLGAPEAPQCDGNFLPVRLGAGDRVLLCSDGVYKALTDEEIGRLAVMGGVANACAAIISGVKRRGDPHQDNFTVLIMEARGMDQRSNIILVLAATLLVSLDVVLVRILLKMIAVSLHSLFMEICCLPRRLNVETMGLPIISIE